MGKQLFEKLKRGKEKYEKLFDSYAKLRNNDKQAKNMLSHLITTVTEANNTFDSTKQLNKPSIKEPITT